MFFRKKQFVTEGASLQGKEETKWFAELRRGWLYMGGTFPGVRGNVSRFLHICKTFKLNDKEIPFAAVMRAWGFDDTPSGQREALNYFLILLLGCTFFCFFSAVNIMTGYMQENFFQCIGNVIFLCTSLVIVWITAWRRDIVINRRYVPLRQWIMKLNPWAACFLICVSLAFLAAGGGLDALAAGTSGNFDLPKKVEIDKTTDISADIFAAIFGETWTTVTGHSISNGLGSSYQGLLPNLIEMLNFAVLIYVVMFIVYLWVLSAVVSAQTGSGSGRGKGMNAWKAFRQVFTASFAVPVLNGFSMFQIVIMGCISIGINFANVMWDGSAKYLYDNAGQNITIAPPPIVEFQATQLSIALWDQALRQAYGRLRGSYSTDTSNPCTGMRAITRGSFKDGYVIFDEGGTSNMLIFGVKSDTACSGSIRFRGELVSTGVDRAFAVKLSAAKIKLVENMWKGMLPYAVNYLTTYEYNNKKIISNDNGVPSNSSFDLDSILKNYRTEMQSLGKQLLSTSMGKEFKTMMQGALGLTDGTEVKLGWATAGLFSYSIAAVQRDVEKLLGSDVQVSYGMGEAVNLRAAEYRLTFNGANRREDVEELGGSSGSLWRDIVNALSGSGADVRKCFADSQEYFHRNVLKSTTIYQETMSMPIVTKFLFMTLIGEGTGSDGVTVSGGAKAANLGGTEGNATNMPNVGKNGVLGTILATLTNNDPILALVSIGARMFNSGLTLLGVMMGGSAANAFIESKAAAVVGAIPYIGQVIVGLAYAARAVSDALGALGPLLAGGLLMGGILLCYILPMIPAIFWIRALLSWVYLVLESIVAASFWLVTHLMPDEGVGFISSSARRGYMLMIDIIIRPPLLIVGVVFSLVLMRVFGVFISKLLGLFFNSLGSNFVGEKGIDAIDQLVFAFIIAYIMYMSCYTIFVRGVNHLPLNISRWIGGGSLHMGEEEEGSGISRGVGHLFTSGSRSVAGAIYRPRQPNRPREGKDKDGKA